MRKFAAVSSACAFVLGIVGFFIRRIELKNVFDPTSGLAMRWASISLVLALLTVLFLAGLAVALRIAGKLVSAKNYSGVFGYDSPVPLYVSALGALCVLAGALILLTKVFRGPRLSVVDSVLTFFALVSAGSFFYSALAARKKSDDSVLQFTVVAPLAFLCFWLILSYRQRAADPVLLDYVYEILALVLCILGVYFAAGFAFGRIKPRRAIFCMNGAVYMSIVTLADGHSLANTLFFVGLIIIMLANSILLCSNVSQRK